jgi:hypothetical protein
MSYFFGSKTQRQRILDRVRTQLAAEKEAELLEDMNFSDWGEAFDQLNDTYWDGNLPKIPVTTESTRKRRYGWFGHAGYIKLSNNKGLSPKEMLGVLLHEMCHHHVEVKYGHGHSSSYGGKRVIGHGKEWKAEMRRVGYKGKVSRFSGKERFC